MADNLILDCYNVLHMHIPTSADTCAAARATIRAAEIQGKASRYAGDYTLIAGVLAFLGGAFSIIATWIIIWNERRKSRNRQKNKLFTLKELINYSIVEFENISNYVDRYIELIKDSNYRKSYIDFNILNKTSFMSNLTKIISHNHCDEIPYVADDITGNLIYVGNLTEKCLEEISTITNMNDNLSRIREEINSGHDTLSSIITINKNVVIHLDMLKLHLSIVVDRMKKIMVDMI